MQDRNAEMGLEKPFSLSVAEVARRLAVDPAAGLSETEAGERRARFGANTLHHAPRASALEILFDQLNSLVVPLLAAAAGLSAILGERTECLAILLVLVINTAIGFVSEYRAVRSMEALRRLGVQSCSVRRGGGLRRLPAEDLVPGDIVLLEAGDVVTADLRLVEAVNVWADESTLTGESVPVEKETAPVAGDAPVAGRSSMLHKGSAVVRGNAVGLVVATGMATELGRITDLVLQAKPEASPLDRKLNGLTAQLVRLVVVLASLVVLAGILGGRDIALMVEAGVALAIAALPEGLPIVATVALARGMWRMARRNVLVERLSAVETLGSTTVILTDKTGTLTENRMTLEALWLPGGRYHIGEGGVFTEQGDEAPLTPELAAAFEIGILCSSASLSPDGRERSGDPMELALLDAGRALGLERPPLLARWPEIGQEAFDSATKMMATVHRHDGEIWMLVKGAPEAVLGVSATVLGEERPLTAKSRERWLASAEEMAEAGLRVLAVAERRLAEGEGASYSDLELAGLLGLRDPPRSDAREAIRACREAGIKVVMVTGDHAVTGRKIGEAVGIAEPGSTVVTGAEIKPPEAQSRSEREKLLSIPILARVSPAQKLDLVALYQSAGEIVAMTGDGVNDAPALEKADIGIAMGLRGTEVAREAADIVLRDDAFVSIVAAIREGRIIFANIRRFLLYLLSCNFSEVAVVALAMLAGLPLPLLPLQILFLNLVTDVFPAFALAAGEGERDVLREPPRDPGEPLLARRHWLFIVVYGMLLTAATLAAFGLAHFWLGLAGDALTTVSFLTIAFAQLWHVFNMRGAGAGLVRNAVTANPYVWLSLQLCTGLIFLAMLLPPVAGALELARLDWRAWTLVLVASLAPVLLSALFHGLAKLSHRLSGGRLSLSASPAPRRA